MLERETCRELDYAGVRRARDLAERSVGDGDVRVVPLGVVKEVEEIAPNLKLRAFAIDVCHLGYSQVDVGAVGSTERVTAQRAVGALGGIGVVLQCHQRIALERVRLEIEIANAAVGAALHVVRIEELN